jgi:hypothetical protein
MEANGIHHNEWWKEEIAGKIVNVTEQIEEFTKFRPRQLNS